MEAECNFIEVPVTHLFYKLRVRGCNAPESIGFEVGIGNDILKASVDSGQVVARDCVVSVSSLAGYDRRGEYAHFVPRLMKINSRDVESAGDVGPIGGPDDAFVSK